MALGGPVPTSYCSPYSRSFPTGVSKIVTVDVKGNSPLWLKVKDLAEGMTYRFRIKAKTFTYGPEIEANITTGPGEGRREGMSHCPSHHILGVQVRETQEV